MATKGYTLKPGEKAIWHYSPRLGTPQLCRAKSPETCPYAGYYHSEDIEKVHFFADNENEAREKVVENMLELVNEDWSISNKSPKILYSYSSKPENRVNLDVLKQMNADKEIINSLTGYDFFIMPKTKDAIQKSLAGKNFSAEFFRDLADGWEKGLYGDKEKGEPYDKWELMEYLDDGFKADEVRVNKPVPMMSPNGKIGYSLMNAWNDYMKIKQSKKEVWGISVQNQDFYIIKVHEGPGRYEDRKSVVPGREFETSELLEAWTPK